MDNRAQAVSIAVSVLLLAASASANPTFYTILDRGSPTLYEVDFAGGAFLEIAALDVPITAFDQEPGTGRLIGWAGGATPGLYEIDPATAATSLIVETTPGIVLDELFYTDSGLGGVKLFEASYTIDPTTGVVTTQAFGDNQLTAFARAPDGETYFAFNGDRLWDSGGPFAELLDSRIETWIADETTLYSIGRATGAVASLGSASWNSAVTIETRERIAPSYTRTSLSLQFGSAGSVAPKALGLAVLPEPIASWLVVVGLGLIGSWGARQR